MLGECANAWGMCKCENVQIVAFVHAATKTLNHLHILTFAHFPSICTFPKHLHICTFAHLHIRTFAHFPRICTLTIHVSTFTLGGR